jgi:site-specific DNA-methyltransferase (adenine-specific)
MVLGMILKGNCLDTLKTLEDNSVDSIVTDPPYELGFMGKSWDNSGIAYNVELWKECLRVLKPGGHLLSFSGSRTYHRMVVAIEDAGFEIRDQIMWIYGSGFPKSLDVSKALDKMAGAEREVVGTKIASAKGIKVAEQRTDIGAGSFGGEAKEIDITAPATEEAKKWSGWGTALKPAHEPIVVARKPLTGTVASNVLEWGTGALNIDGSRISANSENFDNLKGRPITKLATRRDGETDEEYKDRVLESPGQQEALAKLKELGRWPANVIHDGSEEVLEGFPQTAPSKAGGMTSRSGEGLEFGMGTAPRTGHDDLGGSAARFFYCAKASKAERNAGLEGFEVKQSVGGGGGIGDYLDDVNSASGKFGSEKAPASNFHPTVKPLALMRYLVKMVTPPNGVVLDPFLGSGSTAVACVLEGFGWIGCEMTEEYFPIIEARVAWAEKQPRRLL